MRSFHLRRIVIFIASSIFLTSFAVANEILLSKNVPLSKVEKLAPESYQSDLDILLSTLESAYGGKDILPSGQYTELKSGLKNLKNQSESISSEVLCNQIGELTERVNDYHLSVHIEDKICQRVWPKAMVGPNSGFGNPNKTWSLSYKTHGNERIPVLAIQKMSPATAPEWNGFLETVQILVKKNKPIIIDMRRNPGGDSSKGKEMARILYGLEKTESIPFSSKQVYRQQTPEAWALLANTFWLQMQSLENQGRVIPDYLRATYDSLVGYRQNAVDGLIPPLEIEKLGSTNKDLSNAISFPVYVLVDRHCGSSCELTLEALENLPAIQTVGESTTGVVQYGNMGSLYLPSSHIVVRIPTQGSKYDDQRQVEKNGYTPQWKVPSGTDALDFTLNRFFQTVN